VAGLLGTAGEWLAGPVVAERSEKWEAVLDSLTQAQGRLGELDRICLELRRAAPPSEEDPLLQTLDTSRSVDLVELLPLMAEGAGQDALDQVFDCLKEWVKQGRVRVRIERQR
jgi:hypothetical protein